MRHRVRALLAGEADIDLIGETENGGTAVTLARELRPDVVLLDLLMPELEGITATRVIRSEAPHTFVVVMIGADADAPPIEATRAGASAYLMRDTRTEELLRAIRNSVTGQVALSFRAARGWFRWSVDPTISRSASPT